MTRFLFIIGISICIQSCYHQDRNCIDFKTGTFEAEAYLNGQIVKSKSIRNDTIEIDYFNGKTDTSSIRWINECEYIGTKLHPKNRQEEKPLHIKILYTDKDSYTFEYGYVGQKKNKQQGTAKKTH